MERPLLQRMTNVAERILLPAAVLTGVVLRLAQYLDNRSLWIDEATLAKSILTRSFAGLLESLEYRQIAPVGFLMMEKLMVLLFGGGELALRLFPLVCGLLSIGLFYVLCKGAGGRVATWLGVFLFSVSYYLIYYASEVKQYSSDVFTALVCLTLLQQFTKRKPSALFSALLCLAGVVCIFLSQITVFILAGVLAGMLVHAWQTKNLKAFYALLGCGAAWAIAFLINYKLFLSGYVIFPELIKHWQLKNAFLPLSSFKAFALWFPSAFMNVLKNPGGFNKQSVVIPFLLLGGFLLFRNNRPLFVSFAVTVLAAVAASSIQRFPFAERVILYIVPMILLAIALGGEWFIRTVWPLHKPAAALLVFFLLWGPFTNGVSILLHPIKNQELKPLLAYLSENAKQEDVLYLYPFVKPPFEYYQPKFDLDDVQVRIGERLPAQRDYLNQIEQLEGHARVWLLFTYTPMGSEYNDRLFFVSVLNERGKLVDKKETEGAWLYLYDLRQ